MSKFGQAEADHSMIRHTVLCLPPIQTVTVALDFFAASLHSEHALDLQMQRCQN